jgi:hypothetical protein
MTKMTKIFTEIFRHSAHHMLCEDAKSPLGLVVSSIRLADEGTHEDFLLKLHPNPRIALRMRNLADICQSYGATYDNIRLCQWLVCLCWPLPSGHRFSDVVLGQYAYGYHKFLRSDFELVSHPARNA